MAKKSKSSKKRKQRKPNVPVYSVPVESKEGEVSAQPVAAVAAQAPTSNPIASKDATTENIDWPKEYPFFMPDMKRLGIVTGLMVALLLVLNLIFIYVL